MTDILRLILNTGAVAQGVLVILAGLSLLSWAVIIEKIGRFITIRRETRRFQRLYRARSGWNSLFAASRTFRHSPLPLILVKALSEAHEAQKRRPTDEEDETERPSLLSQVMEAATAEALGRADRYLPLLSITVSVSPFLGLFGTVWGVMSAFLSIGQQGSANIATVGPGIAEALITTVAGLAVAMPALVGYNLIVARLRRIEDQAGSFAVELYRQLQKERLA